jgi:hypothetical protein
MPNPLSLLEKITVAYLMRKSLDPRNREEKRNTMKTKKLALISSLYGMCMTASTLAVAGPLAVYDVAIDKNSVACQNWGDVVSCSAPFLNYLAGKAEQTTVADGGYVIPTPQGQLDSYIIVTAGGGAQGNGDISPNSAMVEDGFKSNDTGADHFLAMGKADGTTVALGNLSNPLNNGLVAGDNPGTWDVNAQWLIDALTTNGVRRELAIGFDFNQPQSGGSMDFWGLVTLRDLDGGKADINYEIQKSSIGYASFSTGKSFASMPYSTDFGTVQTATCIHTVGGVIRDITTISGTQCPAGYETKIDNAQSTANTEIINFIPELNADLDYLVHHDGYDVVSTRLLFGCFGGTDPKAGAGYLADAGGATTHCEQGGFSDVFLMAGAPMGTVPEPGTLVLAGAALVALGWTGRRQKWSGTKHVAPHLVL